MDPKPATHPLNRLAMLLFALANIHPASAATRYLTVVNDDARTVEMVEVAPAGSGAFEPLGLPSPLIGGRGGQGTAEVPPGPCVRDLRVVYRDTSVLTVTAWNTCRNAVIHISAARRAGLRQSRPT